MDLIIGLLLIAGAFYLLAGMLDFLFRRPYTCEACDFEAYDPNEIVGHVQNENSHKWVAP